MTQQHAPLPGSRHRLVAVSLGSDGSSVRSPEIEMERRRAVSDLLTENSFRPALLQKPSGPYRLALSLAEERLLMDITCTCTGLAETVRLPLKPLKQNIRDYAAVVDSFYKTAREGQRHKLETLDAGRRALHDEGAETLIEVLENKVILDKQTARRLFSLVYVLHMRTIMENI